MQTLIEPAKQDGGVVYGFYLLAYFDLMGQSNYLAQMNEMPTCESSKREFISLAKATAGTMRGFRQIIHSYFDSYQRTPVSEEIMKLPSNLKREVLARRSVDIRFQCFGDTVVVFFPLKAPDGHFQLTALQAALGSIGAMMPSMLAGKVPVRGAIDIGVGVQIFANEIYGSVLESVSRLEKEKAEYPRIVAGSCLEDFLIRTIQSEKAGDYWSKFNAEVAACCSAWITRDDDNELIVDYLGKVSWELAPEALQSAVPLAFGWICKEEERFKACGNAKLSERYARLANYFRKKASHLTD